MIALSRLYIHPVKSMGAQRQSQALVQPGGFAFDRQFMVTEPDGTFITARQIPELVLFTAAPTPEGLFLTAPDSTTANIRFADFAPLYAPTEVWGNHFSAHIAPETVNKWLSGFFKRLVQLRWTGFNSSRRVKGYPDIPLSFADGYPFMLTNEASLLDLQRRCPASINMRHFRPNLVVSNASAWSEDEWKVIRVGKVIFEVVKPCSRCIFTTISPRDGQKHPDGEPLRTLETFRSAPNGNINFGLNLIARNRGIIRECDEVEILATHPAIAYGGNTATAPLAVKEVKSDTLKIEWQGQKFTGNNRQILLEQLEQQGIRVPYSCRAGICGSCRVRLLQGEIQPLRQNASDPQSGTVLCCSCIPISGLKLAEC